MAKELLQYYLEAKERLIKNCTKCGNCVRKCRIMGYVDTTISPAEIQQDIIDFLKGDKDLTEAALLKVRSCMRCFGCLNIPCPIHTSSTLICELVEREIEERKDNPWDMTLYPDHEALAKKSTTEEEYQRITTPVENEAAEVLFFPGCNVYKQPDKLLNALTIMDEIKVPYSFAPGMTYCCGWSVRGAGGDAEWLQNAAENLMAFAESLHIKQMVFWCPTCMCVLKDRIGKFYTPSFKCVTFGEYILEHMDALKFPNAKQQTITYHEPCKTTYMEIDAAQNSVREILKRIPGTALIEMPRHGKNTICCGCDAITNAFEIGDKVTVDRLEEAAGTGADKLIDVCHNCHWVFKPAQKNHPHLSAISIENYATYLAEAMGKAKEDTLR